MTKIKMPKKEKKEALKPGGAGVLVIDTAGKILLGKRSQTIENPGQWGLPGGSLEPGERFIDAALREFYEETGFEGEYRVVDSFSFVRKKDNKHFKLFILLIPTINAGMQTNEETEIFVWNDFDTMIEREPKHWVLKRVLESGIINPASIEYYLSLIQDDGAQAYVV